MAPLSGNEPTVSARSGDAVAQTGQSQATELNLQVSSGVTGGGSGSVTVQNQASTTIDRTGSASAQSGMAIALTPGPAPTVAAATSSATASALQAEPRTAAASGGASATGLQSQNVVVNDALASVQVNGPNSGDVSVESTNQVAIVEGAKADARSGNTLAAPEGTPAPTLSQVGMPTITAAAGATSAPATSTGLSAQNQVTLTSGVAASPAPSPVGTITVSQSQQAIVQNVGVGVAVSDGACAGGNCPTPTKAAQPANPTTTAVASSAAEQTTTPQAKGDSLASSGSAQATGLMAQNSVSTSADVRVTVQGENKGLIHVLIESITQIFNFGWAAAKSGDAVAANGGPAGAASGTPTGPAPQAASGDAQATGAKVTNDVDISSSASVKVAHDNYNPINLFVDLFAWIGNFAFGQAQSGDVRATGGQDAGGQSSSGGIAQSGSAWATGLDATNRVNMSAAAAVDVGGSNYADIYVRVRFHTYIWNQGGSYAASGNAQSIGGTAHEASAGSQSTSSSTDGAPSGGGGSGFESSVARSGDARAEGHNSSSQIASAQYANGNGSGPGFNAVLPPIINSLPGPRIPTTEGTDLPNELQILANAVGDVHAESGDASSYGFQTGDAVVNEQVSHASNPGSPEASATNSYEFNAAIHGNSGAQPGFAGVNATPIPTPKPQEQGTQSGSNGGRTSRGRSAGQYVESQLVLYQANWAGDPFHSTVRVNVPSRWPGFEQPPMPRQQMQMPEVEVAEPFAARVLSARNARTSTGFSSFNPLADWPRLELPPMPGQSLASGEDRGAAGGPEFGSPGGGVRGPIEALIWSLMGMLVLGAAVTRRGRSWMTMWANSWLRQVQATARLIMGLILS